MTGHIYKKKRANANRVDEERVIMHEGDASSTATESEHGSDHLHPIRPPFARNLRRMIDKIVHLNAFQVLIVSMVVFNWLIVIVELLINLHIFELGRQQVNHSIARILHFINVTMLGLFVLEMGVKVMAMGSRFFKHRMEIFDLIIIVTAFSMILAFGGRETGSDAIAFLIVLRLWRVSKIINSMIAAVKHEAERKMAKERRSLRALEREVSKLREYCLQQEYELQAYRLILHQNAIPIPTVLRVPTTPRTLNVIAEVNEVEHQHDIRHDPSQSQPHHHGSSGENQQAPKHSSTTKASPVDDIQEAQTNATAANGQETAPDLSLQTRNSIVGSSSTISVNSSESTTYKSESVPLVEKRDSSKRNNGGYNEETSFSTI